MSTQDERGRQQPGEKATWQDGGRAQGIDRNATTGSGVQPPHDWTGKMSAAGPGTAKATKSFFMRFWWVVLIPVALAVWFMVVDRNTGMVPDRYEMEKPAESEQSR